MRTASRIAAVVAAIGIGTGTIVGSALPAVAHDPHHVKVGPDDRRQVLADGRNHGAVDTTTQPGLAMFCLDAGEAGAGQTLSGAMYGIETAHHGRDAGEPGRADGCYATTTPITDSNPAID